MKCPGCGGDIEEGAWICPHCEFIVDTSFLGNDITNERPEPAQVRAEDPVGPTAEESSPSGGAPSKRRAKSRSKSRSKAKSRGKSRGSSRSRAKSRSKSRSRANSEREPADAPSGGLDVDPSMILSADEMPADPAEALVRPVEAAPLDAPPEPTDKKNTNVLPDEVLPSSSAGVEPLNPSMLREAPGNGAAVEPPALVIADGQGPKKAGLPAAKKGKGTSNDAAAKRREVLARAMARGPIRERKRSGEGGEKVEARARSVAKETPAPPAPTFEVRSPKAEKIYQQALEDIEAGNLVSARTNLKLALTFDPGNERYEARLEEVLAEEPDMSQDLEDIPKGVQFANQYYEKANEAEDQGDYEEAVKQLERAIRADPQGVYYNRLGSILAFQLGKLKEGRKMVDKAIQMSPKNKKYQKTLSRILEKMGIADDKRNVTGMLGGLLSKRK